MTHPEAVCIDLLKIVIDIKMDVRTTYLSETIWLTGIKGQRLEGVCQQCRHTFPMSLKEVQDNVEVRCWHCFSRQTAIDALCTAHPGLLERMAKPAVDEVVNEFYQKIKRIFR